MNITSKRGALDNVVTYEHYCDEKKDLSNIPQDQITLGSIAIVLKDDGDTMCIYIANSNKEWIPIGIGGGGSDMSDISLANLIDVSLANPADGDTLIYNATSEKWVAQASSGSNSNNIMFVDVDFTSIQNNTFIANKTASEIYEHVANGGLVYLRVITAPISSTTLYELESIQNYRGEILVSFKPSYYFSPPVMGNKTCILTEVKYKMNSVQGNQCETNYFYLQTTE